MLVDKCPCTYVSDIALLKKRSKSVADLLEDRLELRGSAVCAISAGIMRRDESPLRGNL